MNIFSVTCFLLQYHYHRRKIVTSFPLEIAYLPRKFFACGAKVFIYPLEIGLPQIFLPAAQSCLDLPFINRFLPRFFSPAAQNCLDLPFRNRFYIENFSPAAQNCLDLPFRNRFYRFFSPAAQKTEL